MDFHREVNIEFPEIWRIFISGSSGSGKTTLAGKILESGQFTFNHVFYFGPDFHNECPVQWNVPISFRTGVPSETDILALPMHSVLVLDDLYDQCTESKAIDKLFRVLSSKRKLNVMIMSQRFFTKGKFCLTIRNSCNFLVLLTNCDAKLNSRIGNTFNLKEDILKAFSVQNDKYYPYVFIDMTNTARVNGIKIYLDIFANHKVVLINLMKYYLVPEQDALQFKKQENKRIQPTVEPRTCEPTTCRPRISKKDRRAHFDKKVKRIVRKYHRKSLLLSQNSEFSSA